MKRIVREVEHIIYLCGFFGRFERVNLVSVPMMMPSDEEEMIQIDEMYSKMRAHHLPWFKKIRRQIVFYESMIDIFNKNQFYLIENKMKDAISNGKWYRRIFMDKRIPKDVLFESMIDKRNWTKIRDQVDRCIDFIIDMQLQYPMSEDQYNFITSKNAIPFDEYQTTLESMSKELIENMKRCRQRLENTSF